MDKFLIESDLQVVINFIKGLVKVSTQIINHIVVIVNLVRNFDHIQFI